MKQKIFTAIVLLFFAACVSVHSQTVQKYFVQHYDLDDTLETSTTLTYDFNSLFFSGKDMTHAWSYSITIEADSISGANAGTVTFQVSDSPNSNSISTLWYDHDTDTIDGATTQVFHYEGLLYSPKGRLTITSPSGTRQTALRVFVSLKRLYK